MTHRAAAHALHLPAVLAFPSWRTPAHPSALPAASSSAAELLSQVRLAMLHPMVRTFASLTSTALKCVQNCDVCSFGAITKVRFKSLISIQALRITKFLIDWMSVASVQPSGDVGNLVIWKVIWSEDKMKATSNSLWPFFTKTIFIQQNRRISPQKEIAWGPHKVHHICFHGGIKGENSFFLNKSLVHWVEKYVDRYIYIYSRLLIWTCHQLYPIFRTILQFQSNSSVCASIS